MPPSPTRRRSWNLPILGASSAHNLLIACVHLGAGNPTVPLRLHWLLDIRLLLDAIPEDEFGLLVHEAQCWKLADVLIFYCSMADWVLGPCRHREIIQQLAGNISNTRRWVFRWSCDNRLFDLLEYGMRLPGFSERRAFLSEILARWKSRKKHKKS